MLLKFIGRHGHEFIFFPIIPFQDNYLLYSHPVSKPWELKGAEVTSDTALMRHCGDAYLKH